MENKIGEIEKTNQMYVTTFLEYVTYMLDKNDADAAQLEFEDNNRKMRRR